MKKSTLLKLIVMLTVVTTFLSALAGCATPGGNENESSSDSVTDVVTPNPETEDEKKFDKNGYLMDDLPEELRYIGQNISILAWKDAPCTEFDVKEITTNTINNAVYMRDQTIQTRLGVTLKYNLIRGNVDHISAFKEEVTNAYQGSAPYDIVAAYTRSTAVLLLDLGHIPTESYLDFDKPWWNSDIIEKTQTIDGNFYFATGDASTSLVQMTYCVYFNADEVERMQQTSPYALVENNEWTLDKMLTMAKGYYVDQGETGVDLADKLGIVGTYFDWPALLHGCGVGIITRDVTGEFVLDSTIKAGKGPEVMEKLDIAINRDGSFVRKRNTTGNVTKNFIEGNSMFLITESGAAISNLQDATFEFGCVPCPKYDEYQETYFSTVRQPITLFGVMTNVSHDRLPMITAVLECWASEGYRKTTPAIFEQAMKGQSATSSYMTEMLELIRDTAWFDCGRIYATETKYICDAPGDALSGEFTWDAYTSQTIPNLELTYIPLLSQMLNR